MSDATRARVAKCAEMGHPGVTFNPWLRQTWCICGTKVYDGAAPTVLQHLACCGGPLALPSTKPAPWHRAEP